MLLSGRVNARLLQTPCLLCREQALRLRRQSSLRSMHHTTKSSALTVVQPIIDSLPPPYQTPNFRLAGKKKSSDHNIIRPTSFLEREYEHYSPTTNDLAFALKEKLKNISSVELATRADRQVCFDLLFRLDTRGGLDFLDESCLLVLYNMACFEPAKLIKYRVIRISYSMLLSKGFNIDGNGFIRYIVALIYMGNQNDALRIWDQQRASKFYNTQWWWTAGALLFIRLWKLREAESVINSIKERFGSADPQLYAALISRYCLAGQILDAQRCYDIMIKPISGWDSRPPRWTDYETALKSFLLIEDHEYMNKVVNDMEKAGYGARKGQLLAEFIYLTRKGRTGLPVTNSTSLNEYVDQIVRCMPTLATDPSLYEIWLLRLGQLGDGESATIIYKHMLSKAMPIWPAHARCIMLALLRQGDSERAVDFLQQMESVATAMNNTLTLPGQIPCPDSSHYLLLLQYYGDIGDEQGVQDVMNRMANLGIWPDAAFFACLLDYYRKCNRLDDVWEVYHQFCQSQVSFNMPIFRAVWDALYAQAMLFTRRTFSENPHARKDWLSNPSYCPSPMKFFLAMLKSPSFVMEESLLVIMFRTFFVRYEFAAAVAIVHVFMDRFALKMNLHLYNKLLKTLLIHGAGRNVIEKSKVFDIIQSLTAGPSLDNVKYCLARCIRKNLATFEREISMKIRILNSS